MKKQPGSTDPREGLSGWEARARFYQKSRAAPDAEVAEALRDLVQPVGDRRIRRGPRVRGCAR